MSLVGICWNMMAFSIFPKKSVFRKIIITEKICLIGPRYLKLSNAKYILKCRMRVYQVIFKLLAYVA